jgi:hypothetical protein
MLSRSAAEEATQLILCRILAFVTGAAGADPGAAPGAATGDSGDVGAVVGAAAEAMLKELLALLPSADLTGCVGKWATSDDF